MASRATTATNKNQQLWVARACMQWKLDLGKTLFINEDHLQVPFLAGSLTDDAFVSESHPLGTRTEHLLGKIDFISADKKKLGSLLLLLMGVAKTGNVACGFQ
ncbi:hypothetical protein WJX77_011386 [Trebouxia sp. C0004]